MENRLKFMTNHVSILIIISNNKILMNIVIKFSIFTD